MARINLTDRFVKSRGPAEKGKRDDYADAIVPGLALRVTERGHKSFVLVARYPHKPRNPTRRALGDYGAITLDQAREKARGWLELITKGVDPRVKEAREKAAALRRQANSFAAVAEEFLARHGSKLKKAEEAKRILDGEFVKRWGARPITDVMPEEVSTAISAIVKRGSPYQAHNAFGYLRRLFNWAIGTHEFGVTSSPVERLSPKDMIGERKARDRTLTEDELRAVWKGAGEMGYPYGPLLRLLILTGQREREIADLTWREVDLKQKLITIGAHRMKGGAAHLVPLSAEAVALLEALPRWTGGDFVFTTTDGKKPVNGFSKAKVRIDKLVPAALRAAAMDRGEDPEKTAAPDRWNFHDLRRTARTHFSALPVQDLVRELVIAHAKPGLHKVYDLHAYADEKRECLDLWGRRLKAIVEPPKGDNVVTMRLSA
ncbi:MAG: tyrosine-type recombinase/integrase [Hyphomicrobiales bacterium]